MKNILVTWHNPAEGVSSLKYILEVFASENGLHAEFNLNKAINVESVFDKVEKLDFVFDEIVYITTQNEVFAKFAKETEPIDWKYSYEEFLENGLKETFNSLIVKRKIRKTENESHPLVQEKFLHKLMQKKERVWRNIHRYDIENQLEWMQKETNFTSFYKKALQIVKLNVDDLESEMSICSELNNWVSKYKFENEKTTYFIDISTGTTEMQVVWHILSQAGRLPTNTRFFKSKFIEEFSVDYTSIKVNYSIKEIPFNLLSSLTTGLSIYKKPISSSRKLVNKKMTTFLETGFSILLIGERGIGKSQIASEAKKSMGSKIPFIEANCASFDEDSKAEAELFGYEAGSFTGSLKNGKRGLFEEADGGILFLDEIHLLSKLVQGKLMKALQTDEFNRMSIRKMGSNKEIKVECRLIFATNKNIEDLRTNLLPDFYDRIVQHVILIPPLRDTIDDRMSDWEGVWKALKFKGNPKVPNEPDFISWLKSLPLTGNFRDLQKIAIYYNVFNQFDTEIKELINEKSAYQFAKSQFNLFHSQTIKNEIKEYNFSTTQTTKEMQADYLFKLQEWAVKIYNGRKPAIAHFKELGDTITEKTLNDWKNKKSLKLKDI